MRKIVNSTFMSLDGVINHMDRWHFDFIDQESDALALDQLGDSDALLMGRRTYGPTRRRGRGVTAPTPIESSL